jgi:aldose 1-epimerase
MKTTLTLLSVVIIVAFSCGPKHKLSITNLPWGETDGKAVSLYTLTNANGMVVKITNYGGTVTSIMTPDRKGKFENIVLGFDSLDQYVMECKNKGCPYLGALIGRYGNRIAKGKFKLDNKEYSLAPNNWPNHLHGGLKGFDKVVWDAKEISGPDSVGIVLTYLSKDMEEGYPGNLQCTVTYVLDNKNELKLFYEAQTDKPTIINLTNHSYFNLTSCKEDILNHELLLFADSITPVDSTLIPIGPLMAVAGTAFDFTKTATIGSRFANVKGGYDHNYKLRKEGTELTLAAEVYEPVSGRLMRAYTTQPGLQFYSGNFLDGTLTGSGGIAFKKHYGFCLETQHYPDSPNEPAYPSTVLRPGQKYNYLTIYKFLVK